MDLVETHCHLSFPPLVDDIDDVLSRAMAAGVKTVVVPAYDSGSWETVSSLVDHSGVYGAFGLHPWSAAEDLDLVELERRLGQARAVAVGEIGLDFKIEGDEIDWRRQIEVFERQVRLAVDLDLPVILHCRGAFEEMLTVLARFSPGVRGVVHAYSRGPELARRFLELGFYIAFGGAVTRPRAKRAHRSAVVVPGDRFLLETDAPSIGLDGVPAQQTEPRHVRDIALALAGLRNETFETVADQTTDNARRLFGI